jgi:hypothetical protein
MLGDPSIVNSLPPVDPSALIKGFRRCRTVARIQVAVVGDAGTSRVSAKDCRPKAA